MTVAIDSSLVSATSLVVDLAVDANTLRVDSDRVEDYLGGGVAACDFNVDGLRDVALGAEGGDGPGEQRSIAGEGSIIWGRRGRVAGAEAIEMLRSVYVIGQNGFDSFGGRLACGDLNGDGLPDLAGGAALADGPGNVRTDAGEVRIIFGVTSWPAIIDLAVDPSTVIYGKISDEHVGAFVEVGDINGDGTVDLLSSTPKGLNKNNNFVAGRVYGFFGRATWPAAIDLATTPADLTIFGRTNTNLGEHLDVGDLDGDGTDDIASGARFGDTPVTGRTDAGDVYVFRGRATWPASIDLNTQSATTRAYGVESFDYIGGYDGLCIGDLDGDQIGDLAIGVRAGDGRTNAQSNLGEIRLVAPGISWPPTIDLATGTRQIVYGERTGDLLGTHIFTGDVNGDGITDLITSVMDHDGLDGTRDRAGAVIVILGRPGFPVDSDMATGDDDWRIIGASTDDRLQLHGVADLNADGIDEIVVTNDIIDTGPNSVWFVSPIDVDGDGFQQLSDNCPLVANADQLDSDSDRVGDICQLDYDGDGVNDPQDCAMSNRTLGKPGAIKGVTLMVNAATTIRWDANSAADTYSVLRGLVSELGATNFGTCQDARDPDTSDTSFVEDQLPPPGDSFFVLVFGRDAGCGGRGSLGVGSSGTPRVNQNPGDCP